MSQASRTLRTPLVLDTNVVVKWYMPEELSANALDLFADTVMNQFEFIAPGTLFPELLNTFWQRYRRNLLSKAEVSDLWNDFSFAAPISIYDPSDLIERAAELVFETEIIVYDALFIALAERSETTVITADQALIDALATTPYRILVIPLYNVPRALHS